MNPSLLTTTKDDSTLEDEHERESAEDFIELERIDEDRVQTKQYRECALVLYFSDDEKITSLRTK